MLRLWRYWGWVLGFAALFCVVWVAAESDRKHREWLTAHCHKVRTYPHPTSRQATVTCYDCDDGVERCE